jgi:hypothetical protein
MTAFNPGDPVHVSFDGVVSRDADGDGTTRVHTDGGVVAWVAPEHLSPVPTPVLFADINVGDRIRAVKGDTVCEFTVESKGEALVCARGIVCHVADPWQFFRLTPPVPPEPEYEVGAVYQDGEGFAVLRTWAGWKDFDGQDCEPVRPLVRLVPEEPK